MLLQFNTQVNLVKNWWYSAMRMIAGQQIAACRALRAPEQQSHVLQLLDTSSVWLIQALGP